MNGSDNVKPFPIFNVYDVPEALRKVANDIEANPHYCKYVVLCGMGESGTWYKCFGRDVTKLQAIGVIEFAKYDILELLK